ncbi:hypothetical protein UL82_07505 [Corynebacterium kutscheri]|uniref:Uncharacterized protein n=1 Tax=Corynebacterium kutscheri TaxID=35755 RepID=A0A0F6R0C8_9CORY|nr:hypothetical protein UL82_07505 [Corynebacterium kutscheri]VEH09989.1 Uncharacterised protein [Corynebacterium kutscheri]
MVIGGVLGMLEKSEKQSFCLLSIIVSEFTFKSLLDSSQKNFSSVGSIVLLEIVPTGAVIHSFILFFGLKREFSYKDS